jgi:dimethylamine/trimethylamine dehydrogenase
VTPAPIVSAWTTNTLEALPIARRLARLGVEIVAYTNIAGFSQGTATLQNGLTGALTTRQAANVITVTARLPVEDLFRALEARRQDVETAGIVTLTRAGDCLAPSTIQQAVYTGHKLARGLDADGAPDLRKRELPALEIKCTRAA